MSATPGGEADDAVRRDRHDRTTRDREHAVPRDALAQALGVPAGEARPDVLRKRAADLVQHGRARNRSGERDRRAPAIGPNTTIDAAISRLTGNTTSPPTTKQPSIASIASGDDRATRSCDR